MTKKYSSSIFIFRRDYRLNDNTGLINALKQSLHVIPIFILTPEQLVKNKYKSDNAVQFMIESLEELNSELKKKGSKLFYFFGNTSTVIEKILKDTKIDSIFVNKDYTPYSTKRDNEIEKICKKYNCDFNSYEDILLNPVSSIKNTSSGIYTKFTPYFNKAKNIKVREVDQNKMGNYISKSKVISGVYKKDLHKFYNFNPNLLVQGGRKAALTILKNIKDSKDYNAKRNDLVYNTTHLSAYIKFGCVSIREVYHAFKKQLGNKNDLIKQLYWRDFYYNISYVYPIIYSKKGNLKENYDKIKWSYDKTIYNKWANGKTGFPIVDACMREINTTGFMHNRGRLIVSGFLIKILLIDWKWGEKYFSTKLVDIDPSLNTGNWGWSSGSGADSQPYFRIFNPWLQSMKHDPDCEYIKKWIPELKDVDPKYIHQWDKYHDTFEDVKYPKPIVDYSKQKQKALKMYKTAFI